MAKPALGRGLGALLGGAPPAAKAPGPSASLQASTPPPPVEEPREQVRRLPLTSIRSCPLQPRKTFTPEAIRELADSIREKGIVQPLIVRARDDGYELIAGERRWRAAQLIGLADVPVLVRDADDRAVLELALIENLQRENLNPLEEAQGYARLMEQFQLTQEEVAVKVGKNRATVANALRLLRLPPELQNEVRDGRLSVGHAKVILGLTRAEDQKQAAARVVQKGLSVRQTEELVARLQSRHAAGAGNKSGHAPAALGDPHLANLQDRLQQRLGTKVSLRYVQGKGSVEIRFFNDADLERVLHILGVEVD